MSGRHLRGAGREEGFTIIELMIVCIILGVLVSMVVLTMAVSKGKAQDAACKANLRIIDSAIQQYVCTHSGTLPPDLEALVEEGYIKDDFKWMCPGGDLGEKSGDYRDYYDPESATTSCPRVDHNI